MRWFWIDRFEEFRSGERARAVKNVTRSEDCLAGHFPGYPIMPGSLMIEGMAQTAGILAAEANRFEKMVVLAKIARAELPEEVRPGERITYEAELTELREEGAAARCSATGSNGRKLAEAEIVFAYIQRADADAAALQTYQWYRRQWLAVLGVPQQGRGSAKEPTGA